MLTNTTKYFLKRDDAGFGKPLALVRLHHDEQGIWADYFKDNQWIESHAAFDMAYSDSLNVDEIDEKTYLSALDYLTKKSKD
jgi:hypothetical protein